MRLVAAERHLLIAPDAGCLARLLWQLARSGQHTEGKLPPLPGLCGRGAEGARCEGKVAYSCARERELAGLWRHALAPMTEKINVPVSLVNPEDGHVESPLDTSQPTVVRD